MEHWHPNPDFFFQPGAGPVLDVGPYYVTNLIQLLGPVKRWRPWPHPPARRAPSRSGPRQGETIAGEHADQHPCACWNSRAAPS